MESHCWCPIADDPQLTNPGRSTMGTIRRLVTKSAVVVGILLLSALASGQQASSIAGLVKDTSGAVLPGVTVEAASPALIEKVRTVVTEGQGRYSIGDLR